YSERTRRTGALGTGYYGHHGCYQSLVWRVWWSFYCSPPLRLNEHRFNPSGLFTSRWGRLFLLITRPAPGGCCLGPLPCNCRQFRLNYALRFDLSKVETCVWSPGSSHAPQALELQFLRLPD